MTIEEAIQKAIKGGWDDTNYAYASQNEIDPKNEWEIGIWRYDVKVFIDPLFWKALGKAMGWFKEKNMPNTTLEIKTNGEFVSNSEYVWHEFIHHLADGGTIESFFKKL